MLYMIRHGKTDWNEQHILQGRTDVPLNDNGRMMAEKAREEYRNLSFDICYCSPLARAKETSEIILKGRNIPIITDERLVEMRFGRYEGMNPDNLPPDCPIHVLFSAPEKYSADGGAESMEELFLRTGSFLTEVIKPQLEQGRDILIVGHGAMNSALICQIKGFAPKDFWKEGVENCILKKVIG